MLTLAERVYGLSLIWKEAEYNFAFWDKRDVLSWESEYRKSLDKVIATEDLYAYYLELKRFVALLKDGHSSVRFPKELVPKGVFPLELAYVESKHTVVNMVKEFDGKIPRFSHIVEINGMDADKFIEANILPYCWHEKYDSAYYSIAAGLDRLVCRQKLTLKLRTPSGGIIEHAVTPAEPDAEWLPKSVHTANTEINLLFESESHRIHMTNDQIAVVTIPAFHIDSLPEEYYNNLPLIQDARGILFDVRNNGGGSSTNADAVVQSLIEGSFVNSVYKHPIHNGAYKAWASYLFKDDSYEEALAKYGDLGEQVTQSYKAYRHHMFEEGREECHIDKCPVHLKQPVVVLANCDTVSAAEDFLISLNAANRVTIVGSASFGSTGQPLRLDLPGGGYAQICARQCLAADGSDFINIGVQPHVHAEQTLDDWIKGCDSVFDKGIEVLRGLTI